MPRLAHSAGNEWMSPGGAGESQIRWVLQGTEEKGMKGGLGNSGSAPGKQMGDLNWAESTSRFVTPVDSAWILRASQAWRRGWSPYPFVLHILLTAGLCVFKCFFSWFFLFTRKHSKLGDSIWRSWFPPFLFEDIATLGLHYPQAHHLALQNTQIYM